MHASKKLLAKQQLTILSEHRKKLENLLSHILLTLDKS